MRIKSLFTNLHRQWKVLFVVLGIVALSQVSFDPRQSDRTVKVVTVREIYNNGYRNITDLHFRDQFRRDGVKRENSVVGFPDLGDSDCYSAFAGKTFNKEFKKNITRWVVKNIKETAEKDCQSFIRLYGMDRYPPALQEELDFPLSYSIIFHQDFDQVLFLLRAVYRPHNLYCLHPDLKSPQELQDASRAVANCLPNVYITSKQVKVIYEDFSRFKADLNCMEDAVRSPVQWRYHLNMVGQQFPLKSNLEMVRILKIYNGTNDIEGITGKRALSYRYHYKFKVDIDKQRGVERVYRTTSTNPPPPNQVVMIKGSAFGSFSRAFVEFVFNDPVSNALIEWSKSIGSPDEYIWSTLHHSPSFKAPGGNNTGQPRQSLWFNTYANWGERPCYGKYIHGICIFTTQDLPLLLSQHAFFANKFYITFHPAALHCLDQLVYRLTVTNTVTDLDFYRKLKMAKTR